MTVPRVHGGMAAVKVETHYPAVGWFGRVPLCGVKARENGRPPRYADAGQLAGCERCRMYHGAMVRRERGKCR